MQGGFTTLQEKEYYETFDYSSLYKEIRQKQKQELKDALQNYPNHEFHFGMDYTDDRQEFNTSYPYILGYLGDDPVDLKVLAIREREGVLEILARDEEGGFESYITDLDLDVVLGHLENIIDELPDL